MMSALSNPTMTKRGLCMNDSRSRPSAPWLWNEFQQIGTDYTSIEEVASYDKRMSDFRDVNAENNASLKSLAARPGFRILEIGTGTGSFARAAARNGCKVVAIDVSTIMLEYARLKAEEEGLSSKIELGHGGFLSFEAHAASFDGIETGLAFHHLPDLWKAVALDKLRDLLKPGGRLHIRDVVFTQSQEGWDAYFERLTGSIAESSRASFVRHIRQEFSTLDWILKGLLERAGFKVLEMTPCGEEYLLSVLAEKL